MVGGTQSNAGIVGGNVFAAAMREAGNAVGNAVAGTGGGYGGGAPGAAGGVGGPDPEIANVQALNKASQAFSLQLLGLQQEVQDRTGVSRP